VFAALGILRATRMRLFTLSSVASPAVPHLSTLFHKRARLKKTENTMFYDFLYKDCLKHFPF